MLTLRLQILSALTLAMCCAAALVVGCGSRAQTGRPDADSAVGEAPKDTHLDSHQRMVAELSRIKQAGIYERLFYGDVPVSVEETQLRYIAASAPVARWKHLYRLGERRLWLGDTRKAIEHFSDAFEIVAASRNKSAGSPWAKTVFQLGLANLRLGENENCVKCNNGASCLIPIQDAGIHQSKEGSLAAIKYFKLLLAKIPSHLQARWLLNVACMTVGEYPSGVPPEFLIAEDRFVSDVPFPKFANVAMDKGLAAVNLSGGSIVDDFDGDGDLDIVTSSWSASDPILYYRNEAGVFVDASDKAGLAGIFGGLNLLQADYDNDGDIDILVLRGAWMEHEGRIPNSLLRNDGTGHFKDVTFACGLGNVHCPTQTAAWFDFDIDGDLDLYIGNERVASQLFQNDGQGNFMDVSIAAGVENNRFTKGVTCGDFNGDRYPDIYVSNQGEENRLYQNNRDGTFQDVARELGVTGPEMSFATWFWDFNQDGNLDIFVASYSYDLTYISKKYFDEALDAEPDALYQGDANGNFSNVAEQCNLVDHTQPMGSNFGDLNNDGYPDFYLGTGYPGYEALMPNLMFLNEQGRRFVDVTSAGGFGHLQKGHGIAFADLDNDGDQDIFSQMGGAFPGDRAANCLYENPGFGNHWITIKLEGVESNRSAIGAKIELQITADGQQRTVFKWVNSGGSFGANPLRQEIGLGQATSIDKLTIHWPGLATTQSFTDVALDQQITIQQGAQELRPIGK